MKIEVGKYTLNADGLSMWIEETYETTDRKGNPKEAKRRVAGYATSYEILMRQFYKNAVWGSDAQDLASLVVVLHDTYCDMVAFKDAYVEHDIEKLMRKSKSWEEK